MPFATNAPLKVGNETVTVSAVGANCVLSWGAPGYCVLTATFSNKHTTADAVSSGTFGLQEALNDAGASGGGAVTVDSTWASAGGTSGMISAATLPSNTAVEDVRTGASAGGVGTGTTGQVAVYTGANAIAGASSLALPNFGVNTAALPTPSAPTVIVTGSTGTSYTFGIAWLGITGMSAGSPTVTVSAAGTLDGSNYVTVTVPACPAGVLNALVFLTAGPSPVTQQPYSTGIVGTAACSGSFVDIGYWADGTTYPVSSQTGNFSNPSYSSLLYVQTANNWPAARIHTYQPWFATTDPNAWSWGQNLFAGYQSGNFTMHQGASGEYLDFGSWFNTGFGAWTLRNLTTGFFNTAIGNLAGMSLTSAYRSTALGTSALAYNTTGLHNTAAGFQALYSNIDGSQNTAVGSDADWQDLHSSDNTVVGFSALSSMNPGSFNTAVGSNALGNSTAAGLTAIGYFSLVANTTGVSNTAVGYSSLYHNTTGGYNTAVGQSALTGNVTGAELSAFGAGALKLNTGSFSTAFGVDALYANTSGASNTAFGHLAGYTDVAANANVTGGDNTWIGESAGPSTSTQLSNSTAVGYLAKNSASNQVVVGNSSVTDFYAGGSGGAANLHGNALNLATARKGTFICTSGGTITITNSNYIATSDVVITNKTPGGTVSWKPNINGVTPSTGFTVVCATLDTSTYTYDILN